MSTVPAGYAILGRLGEGTYGTVYRAVQTSLRRPVALKVLKRTGDGGPSRRFQREAQVLARLPHPNVLKIYDSEFDERGGYLATEIVPGGSLHRCLSREGPLRPLAAIAVGTQVLAALEFAHHHGVIHRDVKPANVLFAADRTVRLADFGLAYRIDETALSANGQAIGTPHYMPPEAFLGSSHAPGVDVYAVGVMLWELVTGRLPTAGLDIRDVFRAKRTAPLGRSTPGFDAIPERLRALLQKATHPDPGERFESAGDLADALAEVRPVRRTTMRFAIPQPSRWARAKAWFKGLTGALRGAPLSILRTWRRG